MDRGKARDVLSLFNLHLALPSIQFLNKTLQNSISQTLLNKKIIIINFHILTSMQKKILRHQFNEKKHNESGLTETIRGWNQG